MQKLKKKKKKKKKTTTKKKKTILKRKKNTTLSPETVDGVLLNFEHNITGIILSAD